MRVSAAVGRIASSVVLLVACAAAHAFSINVVPSSVTLSQGDVQAFDLVAVDAPDIISTYDIDVLYDPTFLQYVPGSAVFEQGLGPALISSATPDMFVPNSVNLFELSSLSDPELADPTGPQSTNPFTLATLSFRALLETAPGTPTLIAFAVNRIGGSTDSNGITADLHPAGFDADVTITPRPITVPEPASVLLIGAGLVLLAARSRRVAR